MSSDHAYSVLSYCAYVITCFFSFNKNPFVSPSPSSFFLYYVVLLCFPGFFLFYRGNETSVFGIGNFIIYYDHVFYCLLAVYISALFSCFISGKLFKNSLYNLRCPSVSNYAFLVCLLFILCWIVFPKRLSYLGELSGMLIGGSGLESNYLRRIKYAEGFYETKVFTWLRYSLVPFCCATIFFFLKPRFGLVYSVFAFCCLFIVSAASFHKSSWLIPLVYSFLLISLFYTNSRFYKRLFWFIPFTLMPFLLILLYLIQYNDHGFDLFEKHIAVAFERFFSAFTGSILAFISEFRFEPIDSENVLLPSAQAAMSPEEIVGRASGKFTTIQAGVLGSLYSAFGCFGIFWFFIFVTFYILFADFLYYDLIRKNCSLSALLFVFPPVWILQNPIYPSLFSSGFFILFLMTIPVIFIPKLNKLSVDK